MLLGLKECEAAVWGRGVLVCAEVMIRDLGEGGDEIGWDCRVAGKVSMCLIRAALLSIGATIITPGYLMSAMIVERKSHSGGSFKSSEKVRGDVLGYKITDLF